MLRSRIHLAEPDRLLCPHHAGRVTIDLVTMKHDPHSKIDNTKMSRSSDDLVTGDHNRISNSGQNVL
jgi:hypothetical protein